MPEQPDGATARPVEEVPTRRRRTGLLLGLALAVLVVDVVTKLVVVATLSDRPPVKVIGDVVELTELRNTGAAFSFAAGATVVFSLIAAVVVVVIVRSARRLFSAGWAVALGLVLGGAVGNLVDRVFRAPGFLRGGVVDFIKVGWWPVFNVADSAIVCGGILGALLAVRGIDLDGRRDQRGDGDAAGPADHAG